jgi:HPt (histidine-containing phosphotransfer) domain-containing protein
MTDGPLDPAVLAELAETTGADFVADLVTAFLDEAPAMLAELREAAAANDADGFRRAAHSIKSNANVFGATELAELARRMELGGLDDARQDLAALETASARALSALGDLRDG